MLSSLSRLPVLFLPNISGIRQVPSRYPLLCRYSYQGMPANLLLVSFFIRKGKGMTRLTCDETGRRPGSQKEALQTDRQARRVGITCRMFFFGAQEFEGEAIVRDVSTTGCSATSSIPLQVGMPLRLSLFLPDYKWPLRVEECIVRWVNGKDFGLQFTDIRPAQRERLRALIMKSTF